MMMLCVIVVFKRYAFDIHLAPPTEPLSCELLHCVIHSMTKVISIQQI